MAEERSLSLYGHLAPLTTPSDRGYKPSDKIDQGQQYSSGVAVQTMSHSSQRGTRKLSRQIPRLEHLVYGSETSMEDFGDPNFPQSGTAFFREAVSANAFPVFSPYWIVRDGYGHLRYIGESLVRSQPLSKRRITQLTYERYLRCFKTTLVNLTSLFNVGPATYVLELVYLSSKVSNIQT